MASSETKDFTSLRDAEYARNLADMALEDAQAERRADEAADFRTSFRCVCCGDRKQLLPASHVCLDCFNLGSDAM